MHNSSHRFGTFRWLLCALACSWLPGALAQVTIPASLVGSYDMRMQATSSSSPIRDGVSVLLEISSDGALCVDGLHFTNPTALSGVPGGLLWSSGMLGLRFALDGTQPVTLQVASAIGTPFGVLSGQRVAGATTACGQTPFTVSRDEFFRFAEASYTDLFPANVFVYTQTDGRSAYRYYPGSGVFLIVTNSGNVEVVGGKFGSVARQVGSLQQIWANPDLYDFRSYLDDVQSTDVLGAYYTGTYTLSLTDTQPFSPVADGTTLTFVITEGLQLCVGNTVLSPSREQPPSLGQATDIANSRDLSLVWKNPMVGYYYRMELIPDDEKYDRRGEGNMEFVSPNGFSYGVFRGDRTSLDTDCAANMQLADAGERMLLVSLLEERHSAVFPGGPQIFDQLVNGSIVREYLRSGVTLRFAGQDVLAKGGVFGPAELKLGTVANLLAALRSQTMIALIPVAMEGTYEVSFTPAGPQVDIPARADMQLSLFQDGRLCLDGVNFLQAQIDPLNPGTLLWTSAEGGFTLRMDTAAATDSTVWLGMVSKAGLALGSVTGGKQSNLPSCGGRLDSGADLEQVQRLFALAEQVMPKQFPASALTYTRLEGGKVLRYYPATRVLVTVDAAGVQVSGGPFPAAGLPVGSVETALDLLTREAGKAPVGSPASLSITGLVQTSISGAPTITRAIDISRQVSQVPTDPASPGFAELVRQELSGELSGSSELQVENFRASGGVVEFDLRITNRVQLSMSSATRYYVLKYRYRLGG